MIARRRPVRARLAALLGAAVLVVACGGSDDDSLEDDDVADAEFDDEDFDDEDFDDEDFDDEDFADEDFADEDFDDEDFADEDFADEDFADEDFDDEDFDDEDFADEDFADDDEPADADDEDADDEDAAPAADGGGVGPASGVSADELPALLAELEEAGFCDPADVENDGTVSAMHFVADGQVQPACYTDGGADDPRLIEAWGVITDVAPLELYDDVSLLAGYEGATDTLAFVTTLDEAASFFLLAVDVTAGENDPDELRLTMLHELTHVFAQHPGNQLDISVTDASECDTFFNGNGCFRDGAYIVDWIEAFWTPDMMGALPDDGSPLSDDESFELCVAQGGGFTGAYAATHPEEDFAESFSAYVFSIDLPSDLDDKLAFFDQYPEFVELRNNAREQGFAGLQAQFDLCQ